jgi:hypothetical protein
MVYEARKGNRNYLFWVGLALCTIYQSYRYPLQISNAGTSPTYSDTPLGLQAGKFVLASPLIALSAVRWLSNSARLPRWPIVLGTLFLSSFCLIKILNSHDSQYLDVSFWMLFSLVLVLSVEFVSVSSLDRYFCLVLAYAFGSTLVQIFLFFAFGRLPALAFEGGYLVRFGGFLDDPNGFAAIWFLLMGWSYRRFKGWKRFLILTGIVVSLLLTQSWTAIAFFFAMLFALVLFIAFKHRLSAMLAICVLPFFAVFVMQLIPLIQQGFLLEVLAAKQTSIEDHIFPWAFWASRWSDWALLGGGVYSAYESWWAAALVNFGVLWFGAYLLLIAALLICLWRAFSKAVPEAKPVYAGLLLFACYFSVGSLNLPFPIIFPINALFFMLLFLSAFGKIGPQKGAIVSSSGRGGDSSDGRLWTNKTPTAIFKLPRAKEMSAPRL